MAPQPPKARSRLRVFLEGMLGNIDEFREPTARAIDLEQLLLVVLAGLDDLDQGEIPTIFKPTPSKRRTKWPAQSRRLHIRALVQVAALRRRGLTLVHARKVIAEDYRVAVDTIRSWQKRLKLESKLELAVALQLDAQLEKSRQKLGWPTPSIEQIRKNALRDGDMLRALRPEKKKTEQGKKSPH